MLLHMCSLSLTSGEETGDCLKLGTETIIIRLSSYTHTLPISKIDELLPSLSLAFEFRLTMHFVPNILFSQMAKLVALGSFRMRIPSLSCLFCAQCHT